MNNETNNTPVDVLTRINQLRALRDRLNVMGGWFRANQPFCTVLDRSEEWDRKRIRVRNKINARLCAVGGAK